MTPFGESVLVAEFSSMAAGYALAEKILSTGGLEALELAPVSPGRLILVAQGKTSSVRAGFQVLREAKTGTVHDSGAFESLPPVVLSALYSLLKNEMEEALGIVEAGSLTALIEAGDWIAKQDDLSLVDLRHPRGLGGKGLLYFTGGESSVLSAVSNLKDAFRARRDVDIEGVYKASSQFRSLFNLSGQG